MTAPRRHIRRLIVSAVAALALLSGSASAPTSARVPLARGVAQARLTAHFTTGTGPTACNPAASLRPAGPPVVTPGSFMAKIKARGYLIAGVDQSTYHFGYLNPLDGQIEGFDIDMVHAIAAAIFGDPNRIRFVSVSDIQRIPAVQSGEVDIVAHTMTITCDRWKKVDFSTVYLDPGQRILVPLDSRIESVLDLAGRNTCATTGSTSLALIRATFGNLAYTTAVPYWTDCLVLLQEGRVAAISTDETILAGLEAQDPETKIVGPSLASEPYGLAISQQHPDFVRFVNAVLAKMRADGQWAAIYKHWVGTPVPPPPPAQYKD